MRIMIRFLAGGLAAVLLCTQICTADIQISCPSDFSGCGLEFANPDFSGWATASDDSDSNLTIAYFDYDDQHYCTHIIHRTWVAKNSSGDSATCLQMVRIMEPPTEITCPPDVRIGCNESSHPDNTGYPYPWSGYMDHEEQGPCPQEHIIRRIWVNDHGCCGPSTMCWQTISICGCSRHGDCNDDGAINSPDVVYMINYVLRLVGQPPLSDPQCPVINRGDFDCDGLLTMLDLVKMVNYVYRFPAPGPCDPCQ